MNDPIKRMRNKQAWEKVFANRVLDKGTIHKYIKDSIAKTKKPITKWVKRHKKIFQQRGYTDGK